MGSDGLIYSMKISMRREQGEAGSLCHGPRSLQVCAAEEEVDEEREGEGGEKKQGFLFQVHVVLGARVAIENNGFNQGPSTRFVAKPSLADRFPGLRREESA